MRSFFSMLWNWAKGLFNKIFHKTDPDDPEGPYIDRPRDPNDIVCYYGCPNSNKAKKLQLQKTLYR